MKVFITGATGFLGSHVTRDFLAHGIAVRAMIRSSSPRLPEGAEGVQCSFDDLDEALSGVDAVVHLAGKVSRDPKDASDMHWIHVEATKSLLDAMERVGVQRLVLSSTSGTVAVHDSPGYEATEEDDPDLSIVGRWPYYMSKRFQEQEVLARAAAGRVQPIILNPSLLLGPGDERLSSTGDVWKILHGRIPSVTGGTMAVVDVRDCVPIFRQALTDGRIGERYLLNGFNMGVRSFCEGVARAGGVSPPALKLPDRWAVFGAKVLEGVYQAADRVPPIDAVSVDMSRYHWSCSSAKAVEELSFQTRDPQRTILDTVCFLEERGMFRRSGP
jgi:dihydroflavonol-4-reductase